MVVWICISSKKKQIFVIMLSDGTELLMIFFHLPFCIFPSQLDLHIFPPKWNNYDNLNHFQMKIRAQYSAYTAGGVFGYIQFLSFSSHAFGMLFLFYVFDIPHSKNIFHPLQQGLLPANDNFCRLLITFANRLDLDELRQSIGPDLDPHC